MKHLTVLNKNAGSYTPKKLGRIHDILTSSDCLSGLTIATPNLENLAEILREHRTFRPDILGMGGGDGTNSRTLTAVRKVWGYIPEVVATYGMGTMDNLAKLVGTSDGVKDKIKKATGLGRTKSEQLARYLVDVAEGREELHTSGVSLLEVNGRYGFAIGWGLVTKLIWIYYAKTIEQYRTLTARLQTRSPEEYDAVFETIFAEKTTLDDFIDLVPLGNEVMEAGVINVVKTLATGITSVVGKRAGIPKKASRIGALLGINADNGDFFEERLDAKIYIDGQQVRPSEKPTAIYIAAYGHANLGIPGLMPMPLPGARDVPGKMLVGITYASPLELIGELPNIFRGKRVKNATYLYATEVRIYFPEVIPGQVDADFIFGKTFTTRYDQTLKVVSLNDAY